MPVWLNIIIVNAVVGLACYTRGIYLELQSTKAQLEKAKDIIRVLEAELSAD